MLQFELSLAPASLTGFDSKRFIFIRALIVPGQDLLSGRRCTSVGACRSPPGVRNRTRIADAIEGKEIW